MLLKFLFEMSLESGIFLDKLKLARIIPLLKLEIRLILVIIDQYQYFLVFIKCWSELRTTVYINI